MNKTYKDRHDARRGPLELAILSGKSEACDQVDTGLLLKLLEYSPKIRTSLITSVLENGYMEVAQQLLQRLPLTGHPHYFENVGLFIRIVNLLPHAFATEIVRKHLLHCQSETCSATKGPGGYPDLIESILWHAALGANGDLVMFLLQYSNQRGVNVALTAAVKNGTAEGLALVNLLFERGARIDKETVSLNEKGWYIYTNQRVSIVNSRTTVLAEAIRQKRDDLVQFFEEHGALLLLNSPGHFIAAIDAAAESGDSAYMQKLLKYAPEEHSHLLSTALETSMQSKNIEAILLLLEAGAMIGNRHNSFRILHLAIVNRDKFVFDKLLEFDCDVSLAPYSWKCAMDWGDFDILQDLVLMTPSDVTERLTDALEVAATCGNVRMVEFLIQHGANINRDINRYINREFDDYSSSRSPLAAAIASGDRNMAELLLSFGADPADRYAFSEALRNRHELFPNLLKKFREQDPREKKGFGADSLIEAISNKDLVRLKLMIEAGVDVNSLTLFDRPRRLTSPLAFAIGNHNCSGLGFVQQLLDAGADPNRIQFRDKYQRDPVESPLMAAVKTKSEELVELLLEYGADAHRPARRGLKRTPLQQACEVGCCKIVMLLLSRNTDVNEPPAEQAGGTALQFAAISGNIKIFRLLLSRGANLHGPASRFDGRTALEGAAEHGRLEMITEVWNAASGEGFSQKEIDNAKRFAKENGYLPCADYVATLSSPANFTFVPEDPWMGFGSQ